MGMYTELVLKCMIKENAPDDVKSLLCHLFNGESLRTGFVLPEHDFFKAPRWNHIGSSHSFYHVPFALSSYRQDYLFSRSDLKNYDNEIELFLNWLGPYIDDRENFRCVGWTWYESEQLPTLILRMI